MVAAAPVVGRGGSSFAPCFGLAQRQQARDHLGTQRHTGPRARFLVLAYTGPSWQPWPAHHHPVGQPPT